MTDRRGELHQPALAVSLQQRVEQGLLDAVALQQLPDKRDDVTLVRFEFSHVAAPPDSLNGLFAQAGIAAGGEV